MGTYAGKVALVTGSSRGVGKLVAEHLLAAEAEVWGVARGAAAIAHARYRHLALDLRDPAAIQRGLAEIAGRAGGLDILVNNAASLTSQYAVLLPLRAVEEMIGVNLLGAFLVSREAAKLMRRRHWGRIINMSSMAVRLEPVGDSVYAATKAGLQTISNVLARELGRWNITCNSIGITAIETEMLAQLPAARVQGIIRGLAVPRMAQPDDIVNVLDFFASERSSYITAQTVYLGGLH